MNDKLSDLVRRQKLTMVTRMTALCTTLASGWCFGWTRRCTWWITGWRTRGVAGMLVEPSFKVGDACLECLNLFEQSEHDETDGARRRLPIRWGNARWWSKLMHRESILKTVKWSSPRLCQYRPAGPT
jgi:hypothetical protein